MKRLGLFAATLAAYPALTGFVLLSAHEAHLAATPLAPTVPFVWDGKAPTGIEEKEKYKNGAYADLDDDAMMKQLLTDAMGLWNDIPGSFVKLAFVTGDAVDDKTDRKHSIMVTASSSLSSAAYASPQFDEDDPTLISDCDVHINDTKVDASGLAFTIAHELGHCLGLGHEHTNYGSIMGYSRATRSQTLGPDDRAGIIYLYPDPAVWDGTKKELVCGVVGNGRAQGGGLAALLLLPAVLALGTAVRRRVSPSDT